MATLQIRSVIHYGVNMKPPNIFTQQNTEQQPIQRCLTSSECPKMKRIKATGESGPHTQFRCWGSPRGKAHRGEEQTRGLWPQDPDPCGWGETHTVPKPCLWGHMSLGSDTRYLMAGPQGGKGVGSWKLLGSWNLLSSQRNPPLLTFASV